MKRTLCLASALLILLFSPCQLTDGRPLREVLPSAGSQLPWIQHIVKGLKEALATGTERAVTEVAKPDGYFGNQLIKILLPIKSRKWLMSWNSGLPAAGRPVRAVQNRAAEKAAPKAAAFFGDAIRQMSVEDAKGILNGGDTAATDYFSRRPAEAIRASSRQLPKA
jgi:hypothetical protein